MPNGDTLQDYGSRFVMQYISSFAIISLKKRVLVALLCLLDGMTCGCLCTVSLPHGAVSWSAVCDCHISWSHSLALHK